MATNRDFTLKRKNGDNIDILYPTTRWAQVEEKPTTFTPTSHSHGNITNGGAIGSTANLMIKTGASGKLTALPAGTTSQFLRGDGTWATPADTTTLTSLGITATSTELNYTDGVTSNIQTQLNSKLNLTGGTMTGPITMGSNNVTGNNSSIFQAGRIIATNSNTSAHGITSKGSRANMLYLMDGVTGGLAASLLDVDVKNTTTPQKRIAKIGIYGGATSGTGGTPSATYLWLSSVEDNTYNKDATLKVDAQNRVGVAIAGSGRPTQALDVDGKIRMRTATVDADGSDIVVTKGYMLSKIQTDTNNYLTNVSGSGNGTVTFTREGLDDLTWNATHNHNSLYNTKTEITSLLTGKQSSITGAATTITSSDLTKNRALISNNSGKVAVSAVTSTELGYLDGVTSYIQGQLNDKANDNEVVKLSGSQTIKGDKTFEGDTVITGDLTVSGDNFIAETTTVRTDDDLIELRSKGTTSITTPAGIAIKKYDGTNDGGIVIKNDGEVRVGKITIDSTGKVSNSDSAQPVLTRGEKSTLNNNDLLVWDSTNNRAVTKNLGALGIVSTESLNTHTGNKENPHEVTKDQVGLDKVDNTADADKPISAATQDALNLKANDNEVVKLSGAQTISGIKIFNDGIIIPGQNSYIDIGRKTGWFWTRFSGENWTFNNDYTGGGWARNLMEMKDTEGNAYFRIGAQGSSQNFTQMYIGPAYNTYWLSLNDTRALFRSKPQYEGDPTNNNDLTRKAYVDSKINTISLTPGPQGPPGADGKGLVFIWTQDKLGVKKEGSSDPFDLSPNLTGPTGAAATVTVHSTSTLDADQNAKVTNMGTSSAASFKFEIPKGEQGPRGLPGLPGQPGQPGEQGPPGVDGTDATVTKANIDTALSYATGSTRLGISAGTSSTGNNNTLFGNSAGSSLTTGSSNTYIGFESGASNKTSYQNVAIGYQALKLGTSSSNVAIGYQAAHKITSGNDNIILGRNSGESITTSLRNIAIGSFALGKIASSSYIKNIGIGYDAGRFKENGTSSLSAANNSIYIGDSTKGSTSSGNNNEIVIGTNAIGKGSNTVQLGSSDITTGYIGNKTIATEEYVDSKEVVLPSNLIRQTNWNSSTKTLTIEVLS